MPVVPEIVYSKAFVNQNAAIAPGVLFTAPVQGLLRATLAVTASGDQGAAASITASLTFTDESGVPQTISVTVTPHQSAASGSVTGSGILLGNTTVSGSVALSGFSGTPNYDVVVVIEQLF